MRIKGKSKIHTIIEAAKSLPCFGFNDLSALEKNRLYLKRLFYRYAKSGKLIRLKKGFYVTREKIQHLKNSGAFPSYAEFLANFLHQPSYLSLETILYYHNLLTEIPVNFTSITTNKTISFSNEFGVFIYHKVKSPLFCGFETSKENEFLVARATKTKALFDFLYLRKNILPSRGAVQELRINIEELSKKDIQELKKYVKLEGSKKMETILNNLLS